MSNHPVAAVSSFTGLLALLAGMAGCVSSATTHSERPASPGYTNVSAGEAPMGSETAAPTGIGGGPVASSIIEMRWDEKLTELDTRQGQKLTLMCPPNGQPEQRVLGSEVYTDDSSVCAAAVHAGKITPEAGGRVNIEVVSGQARYVGSTRNGVESASTGAWTKSFVFR